MEKLGFLVAVTFRSGTEVTYLSYSQDFVGSVHTIQGHEGLINNSPELLSPLITSMSDV